MHTLAGLFIFERGVMRTFDKHFLTLNEQITLLESRGLTIEDKQKAFIYLSNISYYRLSAYWYTFLEKPQCNHIFKAHSSFKKVIETYVFDRKLRFLIFQEIERIEIAVRTQLIYNFCEKHGNNWFEYPDIFKDSVFFNKFNKLTIDGLKRSNEVFIKHYKINYNQPINPPAWMTLELASLGQISTIFKNIKNNNEAKKKTAEHFGVNDVVLESWLECLSLVRNSCAHHMRLWNRKLPKSPVMPRKTAFEWLNEIPENDKQNRIYSVLTVIQYLLLSFIPTSSFALKIKELLNDYPDIPLNYMGFPKNWQEEKLWS